MQLDNIRIVARREYLQRIRSKGFWIGTVLEPYGLVYHPKVLARLGAEQVDVALAVGTYEMRSLPFQSCREHLRSIWIKG